jgi:hypothetical protein
MSKFTNEEKSLIKSIAPLTIGIVFLISNLGYIYAQQTALNPHFSVEVPNGWVYRENFGNNDHILLAPNEFADLLIADNVSASLPDLRYGGFMVELAPDFNFPIKNAPLDTYVKLILNRDGFSPSRYENATIGGERAIKIYSNRSDLANPNAMTDETNILNGLGYYVIHHDNPYYLNYIANAKDYQKYLPQFEQMVKTFKFTK